MFDHIVVPVDGSTFGELALPLALGIARKTGGEVRLVTVITPLPTTTPPENLGTTEEGSLLLAKEHAEEYQAELMKRVRDSADGVAVSGHVELGSVVGKLDAQARRSDSCLMVMTTHGRGPLRRAWLGSVADGLLRRTPCPILAIRPQEPHPERIAERNLHHVLVTLDGSPESREVLPLAKGLARLFGARLTLLRVVPPHFPLSSPFTSHTAHGFQGLEAEAETARKALEEVAGPLESEGLSVECHVLTGAHPADGILDFAKRTEVDVVAMATHGRGGVTRLILGSVADKVIRGGTVPVLLHRARGHTL